MGLCIKFLIDFRVLRQVIILGLSDGFIDPLRIKHMRLLELFDKIAFVVKFSFKTPLLLFDVTLFIVALFSLLLLSFAQELDLGLKNTLLALDLLDDLRHFEHFALEGLVLFSEFSVLGLDGVGRFHVDVETDWTFAVVVLALGLVS